MTAVQPPVRLKQDIHVTLQIHLFVLPSAEMDSLKEKRNVMRETVGLLDVLDFARFLMAGVAIIQTRLVNLFAVMAY